MIGYGNPLRSDDGVGPQIAEAVGKWRLPHVRSMVCHQLTPELVVPIAAAGQVIFVDAAKDHGLVRLCEVEPAQTAETMTHTVDPSSLLRLSNALYGYCPEALSLTIPAENFSFGEKLSDICLEGMQTALARIRDLLVQSKHGSLTFSSTSR